MKKTILALILGVALVTSCDKKDHTTESHEHNHAQHEPVESKTSDEHTDTSAKLELNNGKKWQTNPEMLPYIQEQDRLVEAFNADNGDYKKLAADLNHANEKLIKSCTMTGKPHDALHVWLTDHMKTIDELGRAANQADAHKLTDRLKDSMETYHEFFN